MLDPEYPTMLYQWEYDLLLNRPKRLHFCDWIYRMPTLEEKLYIVRDDGEGIDYSQVPSGRFCRKCGCIQFLPVERVAKRTERPWSQSDMNYLLKGLF